MGAGSTAHPPRDPSSAGLTVHLRSEAGTVLFSLDMVTGARVCHDLCEIVTDLPTQVTALLDRCVGFDPAEIRASHLYNARDQEAPISGMAGACATLAAGARDLGPPDDTPPWHALAASARDALAAARDQIIGPQ